MSEKDLKYWIESAEKAGYRAMQLAKNFGICRKQLERKTKQHFGKTPQQWLDERRLIKAAVLLARNVSIKEVAIELKFKQFSHFSREFKIFHGLPPRNFVLWLKEENASVRPNENPRA